MTGLRTASELATFLLQTTVEWGVCALVVRVIRSHSARFRVWLALFLAFFAQWAWMWARILQRDPLENARSNSDAILRAPGGLTVSAACSNAITWILPTLAVCYGAGLLYILIRTALARHRLFRALQYKTSPSERLSRIFLDIKLQFPLHDCELWVLPGLPTPATLGWWRPQVIVPEICETHSDADLEAVLWHELTHVRRRDALWNGFVRGCRNLLWFHPCVHRAFAAIAAERELACDAAVIEERPLSRAAYATCLVRFARLSTYSEAATPCIELTSAAAFLNLRVQSILSDRGQATPVSSLCRATISVLLIGAMSLLTPDLHILLRPAASAFAVALPISPKQTTTTVTGKRPRSKTKERAPVAAVSGASAPSDVWQIGQQHDPQLAARHRVGVEVLTQYADGTDGAASGHDDTASPGLASPPGHSVTGHPSWTSIAVGAAERLGSIDMDRDHDHH